MQLWDEIKLGAVQIFSSAFDVLKRDTMINEALVKEGFYAYFQFCVTNPELMKIGLWVRVTEGTSEDWGGEGEIFSHLIEFAQRAQSLGILRDDIPAFDLLMIYSGAVKSWIFDGQHFLDVTAAQVDRQDKDEVFFNSAYQLVAST